MATSGGGLFKRSLGSFIDVQCSWNQRSVHFNLSPLIERHGNESKFRHHDTPAAGVD
jgi:hypothetical protein